jgi:hypothetical protein
MGKGPVPNIVKNPTDAEMFSGNTVSVIDQEGVIASIRSLVAMGEAPERIVATLAAGGRDVETLRIVLDSLVGQMLDGRDRSGCETQDALIDLLGRIGTLAVAGKWVGSFRGRAG